MAFTDRPLVARLLEQAESVTGLSLQSAERVQRWQAVEQDYVALAGEAEDLALHSLDYFHGRPQEMATERRKRIAQRNHRIDEHADRDMCHGNRQ